MLAFLNGAESSCCSSVVDGIPDGIVPGDSFSLMAAAHCMVAQCVAVAVASRAWSSSVVYLAPQPIPGGKHKLAGLEIEAQGWYGHCLEPG